MCVLKGRKIPEFPKIRVPENGWCIMENPIKMDDLGGPLLFLETPIYFLSPLFSVMSPVSHLVVQELRQFLNHLPETGKPPARSIQKLAGMYLRNAHGGFCRLILKLVRFLNHPFKKYFCSQIVSFPFSSPTWDENSTIKSLKPPLYQPLSGSQEADQNSSKFSKA